MTDLKNIHENQALYAHPLQFMPRGNWPDMRNPGKLIKTPQGVRQLENGDIELEFYAPYAKLVEVTGNPMTMGFQKKELEKCEDGYWRTTLTGVTPGFHYHSYLVDGVATINPIAPIGYGSFKPENFIDNADESCEFYLLDDEIPHGEVRMEYYNSSVTGRTRLCYVYTPASYGKVADKRYPVLYVQHGVGENEMGWVWQGKMQNIMDNLIAAGECGEMIVVANTGYAFTDDYKDDYLPGAFDDVLIKDCIPMMDAKYHTVASRHGRCIAGLSMGSVQACRMGVMYPDVFANYAVFSGAYPITGYDYNGDEYVTNTKKINETYDLVFVGAGEGEPFWGDTLKLIDEMRAGSAEIVTASCPGYHEWTVWRYLLKELAKVLFRGEEA
jgi:enterochelin esterase-like enzyme